eukprot:GHVU01107450.1.p1 GENE.GHVU01107450.1~~GHVU01107450.1.p1  ORF type:complete len:177 (+),score=17.52 GHVU01107450.1:39-533(+)
MWYRYCGSEDEEEEEKGDQGQRQTTGESQWLRRVSAWFGASRAYSDDDDRERLNDTADYDGATATVGVCERGDTTDLWPCSISGHRRGGVGMLSHRECGGETHVFPKSRRQGTNRDPRRSRVRFNLLEGRVDMIKGKRKREERGHSSAFVCPCAKYDAILANTK